MPLEKYVKEIKVKHQIEGLNKFAQCNIEQNPNTLKT